MNAVYHADGSERSTVKLRDMAGAGLAGTALLAGVVIVAGRSRWNRTTARLVRRLGGQPATPAGSRADAVRVDAGLPAPVLRYFQYALAPEQRLVATARFRQRGVMRSQASAAWAPFTAAEHFSTSPPGFVWDATVAMMPAVSLSIRDSYVGCGASEASVLGLLSVQKLGATPEVTAASLLRYLAESAWLPTALLPQAGVRWTPIDDTRARATLSDSGTTVSLEVTFAATGALLRIDAQRHRDVEGVAVLTPWSGTYANYERIAGMMIPTTAEVAWSPPEGTFSAWRGEIVDATYTFR